VLSATAGEGKKEITVFGVAFSPNVVTADLELDSGGHRRVKLKLLNRTQQRNAGVRSFSYGAFALSGNLCLHQVTGYNAEGKEIYRGPSSDCAAAGA
jgi:hypothetical protein